MNTQVQQLVHRSVHSRDLGPFRSRDATRTVERSSPSTGTHVSRPQPLADVIPALRAVRERLIARAFLFENPREYIAGVDDMLRAFELELDLLDPSRVTDASAARI